MHLFSKIIGGRAALKLMKGASREFRTRVANAMNKSAWDAKDEVIATLKRDLDRPTPYTVNKKAVFVRRAFPNRLRVIVEMQKTQASYLKWQIYGGTKEERTFVPYKHMRLNRYGNKPKGWSKPTHGRFWATIKGVYGLWERQDRGVKLLAAKESSVKYDAQIPFHDIVVKTYRRNFPRQFKKALTR